MPENLRNVLNRYTFTDQICCQGPAETVRVDIAYTGAAAEVLNNVLDSLLCEPAVRILEPHKQQRGGVENPEEMYGQKETLYFAPSALVGQYFEAVE